MAKPRVFVSSTYYDLRHIRASLEIFIESLGYEAILSEKGDIAYSPDQPLDESCYREVRNADIFVLIMGGRYGEEASGTDKTARRDFYERYDSITKQEYLNAVSQDIPLYILIEKGVYADYETYLRNKGNTGINYAHVDSVNVFKLIEFILAQPRNNPMQHFDRYSEIENWLREQWAGLFRELISRMSSQTQLTSLSAQVAELGEVNKTLRRYLEEVVSKISPESSANLIESETERLTDVRKLSEISSNVLINDLHEFFGVPLDALYKALVETKTVRDFMQRAIDAQEDSHQLRINLEDISWDYVNKHLNEARESIGLEPMAAYRPRQRKKV